MGVSTRISILLLGLGAALVALAYGLSFALTPTAPLGSGAVASSASAALAPWVLAIGATLVLTGLGLLGAGPRAPRLAAAVLLACACTLLGFAVALTHAPHAAGGPLLFGLPRATALMLALTGGIPLILLPLAYAWAFPREVARDG